MSNVLDAKALDHTLWKTELDANDSTPQEVPGIIRKLADGRAFRYCQMTGAAAAVGRIYTNAAEVAVANLTSGTDGDGRANALVTYATGGLTAGAYVGWYLYINTGTGEGQLRKVIKNTASTFTLDYPLATALNVAGTDDGKLIAPPHVLIVCPVTTKTTPVVGVCTWAAITQNYWGWFQVAGLAPVIFTSAPTAGNSCVPGGATTAGQAQVGTTAKGELDEHTFGRVISAAASSDKASVVLLRDMSNS